MCVCVCGSCYFCCCGLVFDFPFGCSSDNENWLPFRGAAVLFAYFLEHIKNSRGKKRRGKALYAVHK